MPTQLEEAARDIQRAHKQEEIRMAEDRMRVKQQALMQVRNVPSLYAMFVVGTHTHIEIHMFMYLCVCMFVCIYKCRHVYICVYNANVTRTKMQMSQVQNCECHKVKTANVTRTTMRRSQGHQCE